MGRQSRAIQEPKDKAKPTRHETVPPPQSEQVCPATTALWTWGRGTTDASPRGAMKGRPASGRPRRALSTFRPWKQCTPSLRGRCQEQVHTSLPGSQGGTPRDQLRGPVPARSWAWCARSPQGQPDRTAFSAKAQWQRAANGSQNAYTPAARDSRIFFVYFAAPVRQTRTRLWASFCLLWRLTLWRSVFCCIVL